MKTFSQETKKNILKFEKEIFCLFLILGIFLRFYKLGSIPSGLYFDEILYGLDAFSILKTGRDIYGHFLPLAFQSSGYYPPLFPYVLAPFLLFTPLSAFTVRFPVALLGILSTVFFYFFLKNLLNGKRTSIPIISFILLTILPWHVHLTRVAFLSSLGLSLMILGFYFLAKSLRKVNFLILSSIFFSLATFSHYGYRLITPVLFFLFLLIYGNNFKRKKGIFLLVAAVWSIAFVLQLVAYSKFNANFWVNRLVQHDLFRIGKEYLNTFSPSFLFIKGENYLINNPWNKGQLPVTLLPFLILGFFNLFRFDKRFVFFVLSFLLITPIPSAIAGQGAHAVRDAPLLIPLVIIIAIGVNSLLRITVKLKMLRVAFSLLILMFLTEIFLNTQYYFTRYPSESSNAWGQTSRESIIFANKSRNDFENVVITDFYNVNLLYFAFETKADPNLIQKAILSPVPFSGLPAKKLGNYYFLTTEEIKEGTPILTMEPETLLIDPFYFIKDQNLLINKKEKLMFQYFEIKSNERVL